MARWVHLLVLACMIGSLVVIGVSYAQGDARRTLRPRTQALAGMAFHSAEPLGARTGDGFESATPTTTVETAVMAAPAAFTYLMVRWRATAALGAVVLELRASENGRTWTAWGIVLENDDLHDASDPPDLHWSGTSYTGLARFWQLQATRQGVSPAPVIDEVQVDTVDARGDAGVAQAVDRILPAQAGE